MDLRSGHPFWLVKNGLLSTYPSLRQSISCDVAVIGAGITGALTAYYLTREGVDTVVIDRRDVATGSTAASTALLQHAADTELVDLAEMVGEAAAVRSYRLGLDAVAKIEKLVHQIGDQCGFEAKSSLYLASVKSHVPKLRQEFELRRRHGFDVCLLDEADIESRYPFTAPAAILAAGDGQIDAFRLCHRLLEVSGQNGARVFDRTGIERIVPRRDSVVLTTDADYIITARRIVFATGYESQRYLKQKIGDLNSTFAFITEPVDPFPDWPEQCLIWETARPYCYLRSTEDGRILIGGKDTPFATAHRQEGLVKKKTKQLQRRLEHLFPETTIEISYAWAGVFGTTDDGLPFIGVSPEWPNAYFALGYGGNGITMSLIAAEQIVDHYLGRDNPDAQLFRFDR
jgi:glycine/D-amino acid oxidase-like deaminating enzyme